MTKYLRLLVDSFGAFAGLSMISLEAGRFVGQGTSAVTGDVIASGFTADGVTGGNLKPTVVGVVSADDLMKGDMLAVGLLAGNLKLKGIDLVVIAGDVATGDSTGGTASGGVFFGNLKVTVFFGAIVVSVVLLGAGDPSGMINS